MKRIGGTFTPKPYKISLFPPIQDLSLRKQKHPPQTPRQCYCRVCPYIYIYLKKVLYIGESVFMGVCTRQKFPSIGLALSL
jgi:hypothetical protein